MANVKFEIIKQIHCFPSEEGELWHKELNLVSWNGRMPRYDIRGWNDDHTKMTKGITLTETELRELVEAAEGILY